MTFYSQVTFNNFLHHLWQYFCGKIHLSFVLHFRNRSPFIFSITGAFILSFFYPFINHLLISEILKSIKKMSQGIFLGNGSNLGEKALKTWRKREGVRVDTKIQHKLQNRTAGSPPPPCFLVWSLSFTQPFSVPPVSFPFVMMAWFLSFSFSAP